MSDSGCRCRRGSRFRESTVVPLVVLGVDPVASGCVVTGFVVKLVVD